MKRGVAIFLAVLLLTGCGTSAEAPAQLISTDPPPVSSEETTIPEPEILELEAGEVTLESYGQMFSLYSGTIDPAWVTWISTDESVATVDSGVVTAVERGETFVTAQYEDQSVCCRIVCDLPVLPKPDPDAGERDPMYLPPDVEIVDDSFFDDAVFVGDSQGLALSSFAASNDLLGDAVFLSRNSYSIYNATYNKMLLRWRGQSYSIEKAIQLTGAKKVFIMLGMNDVGSYSVAKINKIIGNWEKVLSRIRKENPDVQIFIQSAFYAWTGGETKAVNNEKLREYNAQLKTFAEENDCVYIDVASWLVDSTGGTATCYSYDKYVHINNEGMKIWVQALKACTDYD